MSLQALFDTEAQHLLAHEQPSATPFPGWDADTPEAGILRSVRCIHVEYGPGSWKEALKRLAAWFKLSDRVVA